eukprot:351795-Chlamydomonas_euryale.AAC.2
MDGRQNPVVIVIMQSKSQLAVVRMLSVVENAGVALEPHDARDWFSTKKAVGKYARNLCTNVLSNSTHKSWLHSHVLGDGSNQTAPCQTPTRF